MVESDKCTPSRSLKALCNRPNVHISKGYPNDPGFFNARLIKALRTSWLWVGLRPDRGLSSKPAIPSALNRLTHTGPITSPLKPAFSAAFEAVRSGSSNIAAMILARCTNLRGSFRDATIRLISLSS